MLKLTKNLLKLFAIRRDKPRLVKAKVLSETLKKMNDNFVLKILYRSENFLVVDKNFDLVMNDDDPERFSLAKLIKRELPELYNDRFVVSVFFK